MPDAQGRIKGISIPKVPWHIVEDADCSPGSIYTEATGTITCHPRNRKLAERILVDHEAEASETP